MFRIVLTVAAVAAGLASAAEPSKAEVKKLAAKMGAAMVADDIGGILDHTYPAVIEQMGGREKAMETLGAALKQMKGRGVVFKKHEVGEPDDFVAEGGSTFVVVPTLLEMTFPMGTIRGRSFLLGISADGGKTWKFVDGSGLRQKEAREKLLPKLPAKLKLPAETKPELIKD